MFVSENLTLDYRCIIQRNDASARLSQSSNYTGIEGVHYLPVVCIVVRGTVVNDVVPVVLTIAVVDIGVVATGVPTKETS
jgi:hypothetical protein